MTIKYVAEDGTEFLDKYDCLDYEESCYIDKLSDIKMYDEEGNLLSYSISSDFIQATEKARKIVIPNEESYTVLIDYINKYNVTIGFDIYDEVISEGIWYLVEYAYMPYYKMYLLEEDYKGILLERLKKVLNLR